MLASSQAAAERVTIDTIVAVRQWGENQGFSMSRAFSFL